MQKKFVGSLALLLFANFLIKPIWIFGIDLKVQNLVEGDSYGLYASVFSFVIIFNIVLDMGLAHYSNREIASDQKVLARHFSELFFVKVSLAFVYFIIAMLLGFFLDYWSEGFTVLLWLSLSQIFSSLLYFLRSHFAGLHLFKWDTLFSVLDKSLMILLAGYIIYFSNIQISIELFAALQALAYGLTAGLALVIILWKVPYFKPSFEWPKFKSRLHSSIPYALMIFLMSLYTRVDSVMLQQLVGNTETAIYAQAFRLLDTLNQPAYLFSVLLLPMFATLFARKDSVSELAKLAFVLIYVMTLSISLGACFEAPAIMDYLYIRHSEISSTLLQVLLFSSLASGATFVFGTMLTARGNLRQLNYIALGGFALNAIMNAALIPFYGAMGAAVATIGTQSLSALLQFRLSYACAKLNWPLSFLGRFLAYTLQSVLVAWGLSLLGFEWYYSLTLIIVGVALSALMWKLLPWRNATELLKERLKERNSG